MASKTVSKLRSRWRRLNMARPPYVGATEPSLPGRVSYWKSLNHRARDASLERGEWLGVRLVRAQQDAGATGTAPQGWDRQPPEIPLGAITPRPVGRCA